MKCVVSNIMLCVSVLMAVCSCQSRYRIDGITEAYGHEGSTMYLVYFEKGVAHTIDSCIVNHGRFHMENTLEKPRYVLIWKNNQTVLPLIIEDGNIEVKITPEDANVSGTPQNEILYSFLHEKEQVDRLYDEINQKRIQLIRQKPIDVEALNATRDSLSKVVVECESLVLDFFRTNWTEPAAQGVFMMLTWNLHDNVPRVIRNILDEAPEDFMQDSYVIEMVSRVGYEKPVRQ